MKKLIYLLFATVLFCSCEKDELFEQPVQGGVASGDLPKVIYATVAGDNDEGDKTRTVVAEDGNTILWNKGDAITYIGPNTFKSMYQYDGEADRVATAAFTYKKEEDYATSSFKPEIPYAVYPHNSDPAGNYCRIKNGQRYIFLDFPEEQTYAPNSFGRGANVMVAAGKSADDTDFYFRNVCGYLVIKLYGAAGTKVKKIELTALGGEKISGYGNISISDADLKVEMESYAHSTVTLNCGDGVALGSDAANATEFWFALPPVTFEEGFKIFVTPTTGMGLEMQTSKRVVITRRDIQPMAALQFIGNTQSEHQLIYTRASSTEPLTFSCETPFDANITAHYYDSEKKHFVIEFDRPLTTINANAFNEFEVIDELIGDWYSAPENVTDITSVTFPKSLTTIGKFAFAGTALRELTIPGNVTQVGYYAFWECRSLERVSILEGDQPLMVVTQKLDTARGPFAFSPLRYIYINRDIDYRSYDTDEDKIYNWYEQYYHGVRQGLFSLGTDDYEKKNYPGTVDDITVEFGSKQSTIYPYMFAYRNIKSITIPSQVTLIGKNAFESCNDLESVTIQAPQATIDDNAFKYCKNLKTADISVDKIGLGSFYECSKLESVTIQSTVNEIKNDAFYNCKGLKSLTFEPGSTTLTLGYQTYGTNDQSLFYDCPLETLNWNRKISYTLANAGTVDAVNEGLFAGKANLTNVTIGEQVQTIPPYTFAGSGMTSITIPSNVGSIGDYAYYNSDNLTSVNVPSTVATIGLGAFYDCDGLTSATINSSTLGSNMFDGCDKLATVTIGGTLDAINVDAFTGCSKLSTLNISGSVGSISDHAFDTFPLTSLNISGHVGTIGAQAFNDNDYMTSFIVTGSVGTIGASAFEDSDKLATVNIAGTVDRVCEYAFSDCDAVTTLAIRANTVEAYAYEDMDGLKTATLYGATVGDGVFYDCDALQTLVIDGGVNSIGYDAFYSCGALKNLTFEPSSNSTDLTLAYLTYGLANLSPFYDCPLETLDWNRNLIYTLTGQGSGLFARKANLTVTIGNQVKTIPTYTFFNSGITSITIPGSVGSIGDNAFEGCTALTSLTFSESTDKLIIGYQCGLTDDAGPFYQSPLTTIKLYRELEPSATYKEELDAWDMGIFTNKYYNDALTTSVTLGSNVKTIWPYMFSCVNLTQLWIPSSVNSIGDYAFSYCDNLGGVTLGHHTPPTIGTGVFDDCKNMWYISVPKGTANTYKGTAGWKDLTNFNNKEQFYYEYE